MRRVEPLLALAQRVDGGRQDAGGQQGSFDGVGGLSRQEHRLDVMRQGAEEVGQSLAGVQAGKVHLGRERLVADP